MISIFLELDKSGELDRETVIANLILLFLAGYEATAKFIGNVILVLHQHSDQLQQIKKDLRLLPNALREVMRFESPLKITAPAILEDIDLNGIKIANISNDEKVLSYYLKMIFLQFVLITTVGCLTTVFT